MYGTWSSRHTGMAALSDEIGVVVMAALGSGTLGGALGELGSVHPPRKTMATRVADMRGNRVFMMSPDAWALLSRCLNNRTRTPERPVPEGFSTPSRGGHLQAARVRGYDTHALQGFAEATGWFLGAGRGALLLGAGCVPRAPAAEFRSDPASFSLKVLRDVHRVG
jgi:hypothetical protein